MLVLMVLLRWVLALTLVRQGMVVEQVLLISPRRKVQRRLVMIRLQMDCLQLRLGVVTMRGIAMPELQLVRVRHKG